MLARPQGEWVCVLVEHRLSHPQKYNNLKSITNDKSFCYFKVSLSVDSDLISTLEGQSTCTYFGSMVHRF